MKDRTLILWDLDGTLYPTTKTMRGVFKRAACDGVRDVAGSHLTDEDVMGKIEDSRKNFGDSFSGLVHEGHDETALHKAHHDRLDHGPIERSEELIAAFQRSKNSGIRHALLTHGHKNWATRVLDKLGIREFFEHDDIISIEQIGFIKKHTGPDAFRVALDRLGATPEETIMAEDKAANLVHPHAMGMKTVLVHHNDEKLMAQNGPYIDKRFARPEQVIDHVMGKSGPSAKPNTRPGNNPS